MLYLAWPCMQTWCHILHAVHAISDQQQSDCTAGTCRPNGVNLHEIGAACDGMFLRCSQIVADH
jgi:hypothetical protein